MPLVLSKKNEAEKMSYLQTLFTEVYFKDIIERYDIGLPDVLNELNDALCSSAGSLTNVNKIKNTLETWNRTQTAEKYERFFQENPYQ